MFVERVAKKMLSPFRGDTKSRRLNNMPLLRSFNFLKIDFYKHDAPMELNQNPHFSDRLVKQGLQTLFRLRCFDVNADQFPGAIVHGVFQFKIGTRRFGRVIAFHDESVEARDFFD